MSTRTGLLGCGLALILSGTSASAGPRVEPVDFEVDAGPHERVDTPVAVRFPEAFRDAAGLVLEDLDDHRAVPVRRSAGADGAPPEVVWIVRGPLRAGTARRYRLSVRPGPAESRAGGGVKAIADGKPLGQGEPLDPHRAVTLQVGGTPVLTYQVAVLEPPAGIDPVFRRSGFIHPLRTPSGLVVTDDFPPDHAHQHGLFSAWVNTTFEGRRVDFWNQIGRTGRVSYARDTANRVNGGPVYGEIIAETLHEDLTAPGGPKPVLRDRWRVRVYDVDGPFLVDIDSTQRIVDGALTINKYHYGGLALRGNRQWFSEASEASAPGASAAKPPGDFLTGEGKARIEGNHTHPRWVDHSGPVDGKVGGVAILDSPSNFRFPQAVRLHPTKPYFCFAPMVDGAFTIAKDHPYRSRYRIVVHDGPPDAKALEHAWRDYAEPPRVRVVAGTH